jgi:probable rRNA maturation factor
MIEANASGVSSATGLTVTCDVLDESAATELGQDYLCPLVTCVLAAEGATGVWIIAVVLTSDDRLRELHRDFMGIDTPTDVMTFPLGDWLPDPQREHGGDIVISTERAAAQAAERGHDAAWEVRFLLAHGLLHLQGWDDADPADRARMLDRQASLLSVCEPTRS